MKGETVHRGTQLEEDNGLTREKVLIDLRSASKHDLAILARLLLEISTILSTHGMRVQVTKRPAKPCHPHKSLPFNQSDATPTFQNL